MNPLAIDSLDPTYTIYEDEPLGIIRVVVSGFFDESTLARHFADKARVVNRWRVLGRPICVLIDAVDLKPHSPGNQAYVEQATARIYGPADRVAVKVASSLVKMQTRRALSPGNIANFFISESAAVTWLTANALDHPDIVGN